MKETFRRRGSWLYIFLFVLFVNLFLFHSFGAMAAALLMIALALLEVVMLRSRVTEIFGRLTLAASTVLAATVLYVASPEKYALIALAFVGTIMIGGYCMLKPGWISGILELIATPIMMGLAYLGGGITLLIELISGNFHTVFGISNKDNGKSAWLKSSLIGIVLGIPLIIWLTSTLSNADPIFASYTKWIFSQEFWNNWLPRVVFSVLVAVAVAPVMFMRPSAFVSPLTYLRKVSWSREVVVITTMVVMVLAAFLIVQWPYVFASVAQETDLSKYGVATYSEYVQRGFWDLLKVAAMVFGVAWAGLVFGKNSTGLTRQIYFGLQAVLGIEFVVFIASIFRRVWLYQAHHGLSLARLYGLIVLIWIMGMVVTMILRYVSTKIAWVRVELAWLAIVVLATIGINLERLVVKYPPTVNGRVDYVYLSRLPGDGYEGWHQAYEWAKQTQFKIGAQSGIISRESRRETYYAWLISAELANNYHNLIMQYGSEDDVWEYVRLVISKKLEDLDLNMMSDSEKSRTIPVLNQVLGDLESKEWAEKVDVNPLYNHRIYNDFASMTRDQADSSFYMISNDRERERLGRLDSVLAWSGADQRTYQRMKQEIGVEAILVLQRQNMELLQRIAKQAKSEQDFDIDIALYGSFLR